MPGFQLQPSHDADLYRMYYTAADKIERQGGRNRFSSMSLYVIDSSCDQSCKQGAAGSSPATSTNHLRFNDVLSKLACDNTLCLSRGQQFESPHVHRRVSWGYNRATYAPRSRYTSWSLRNRRAARCRRDG
jgi:hypothetical protein